MVLDSGGLCEHGTGSVAEFVNMILDQWRNLRTWYWVIGGLFENGMGQWWIFEHGTRSVADFVKRVLVLQVLLKCEFF
jgi:hypothetical protein